jgi:hypothetical protein
LARLGIPLRTDTLTNRWSAPGRAARASSPRQPAHHHPRTGKPAHPASACGPTAVTSGKIGVRTRHLTSFAPEQAPPSPSRHPGRNRTRDGGCGPRRRRTRSRGTPSGRWSGEPRAVQRFWSRADDLHRGAWYGKVSDV